MFAIIPGFIISYWLAALALTAIWHWKEWKTYGIVALAIGLVPAFIWWMHYAYKL